MLVLGFFPSLKLGCWSLEFLCRLPWSFKFQVSFSFHPPHNSINLINVSLRLTHSLPCWLAGLLFLPAYPATASTNGSTWLTRALLKEDGLPDTRVTGLAQTPDGYL